MPVPVAPHRWPLLGHTPAMLTRRAKVTDALHEHGDVVRLDLGPLHAYFVSDPSLTYEVLVAQGSKFRKGAMFDKFQPYLGTGLSILHFSSRDVLASSAHGLQPPEGIIASTRIGLRSHVGIDMRLSRRLAFRYSFSETISRNPISPSLSPPAPRRLANFQNLFGFVACF